MTAESTNPLERSFTCPVCGLTSHNPVDVLEGYCGACHRWTGKTSRTPPAKPPAKATGDE